MTQDESVTTGQTIFDQAFELWIWPEVERRQGAGTLPDPVPLNAAQVIFPSPREKRPPYVRLNDEVVVEFRYEADRPIQKGELISIENAGAIHGARLAEGDEPNAGHLTMMNVRGEWFIGFDFKRDKQHAQMLTRRAREFHAAASLCFAKGLPAPGLENLFHAAELAAKAELLVFCFYPYNSPKDHGAIVGRYATWVKYGNAPMGGNAALSKLKRLRPSASYAEGDLGAHDHGELLSQVDELIKHVDETLNQAGYRQSEEITHG